MIWPAILSFFACSEPNKTFDLPSLPQLPEKVKKQEPPRMEPAKPQYAAIALVGEVRGEIEPCGCPTLPFGGFVRRENYLKELRSIVPTFHLDAGEMLLKGFSTISHFDAKPRAEVLVELSEKVGVDAWTVGPSDISALGLDVLQGISHPKPISATWVDQDGKWLFQPATIIEKQGIRLGVIGLSAQISSPKLREKIQYLPPEQAVTKALKTLPDELDLIVALGSVHDAEAKQLARQKPQLAAILTTRGASYTQIAASDDDLSTPVVIEAPERGRYVQTVYVRLGGPANFPLYQAPSDQLWRDWIQFKQTKNVPEKMEAQFENVGKGRNLMYAELVALNKSYDGKSEVDEEIENFKQKSIARATEKSKELPPLETQPYASASTCHGCHSKQFAQWTYSSHAKAWQSLLSRKEQNNPECIACHSTGYGEPGGFGELTQLNIRKFKAVQCESCHGPMAGHPADKRVQPTPITIETCTGCHDSANSPNFEFAKYLQKAGCKE